MSTPAKITPGKITRGDIEARFRALQGDVVHKVDDSKARAMQVAAAAGIAVVVLAFLLGKRKGRKKTTMVEIRRL